MNLKHKIIAGLVILGVGYGIGRYLQPANVQIKKEEIIKRDTVVVDRYITRPDGTIERERREENRSEVVRREDKKIVASKPQWKVSALAAWAHSPEPYVYGAVVERRILGSTFIGVGVAGKTPILSLGFEF